MNKIDPNIRCPSCNGKLYPRMLVCESCGIKVEGNFKESEFNSLTPEELHFLRVFIQCEGRISDMETVLGVSYPTVKSHLASLKQKLGLSGSAQPNTAGTTTSSAPEDKKVEKDESVQILEKLESGAISYKDAVRLLKNARKKGNV